MTIFLIYGKDCIMGWSVSLPNLYVEILNPSPPVMTVFGDRVIKEVIKVKWRH